MSPPLSNTQESGFREEEDFMAISCVIVEFEDELKKLIGLEVPLKNQVSIIINPDNLPIGRNYIGI
jgi:hypothetical protein